MPYPERKDMEGSDMERPGSASIFLEIADPSGQASFTIPVSIQALSDSLLVVKVDANWVPVTEHASPGLPAQVLLSLGAQEPYLANGKVAWRKDLGPGRPLFVGLELTESDPQIVEILSRQRPDCSRDITQLWERWEQVRQEASPLEDKYRQAYTLGMGLMFIGLVLPLVGIKTHTAFNYSLIVLGGLICGTKNLWSYVQKRARLQ